MASIYDRTEIYDLFETEQKFLATKKHWETVLSGKFSLRAAGVEFEDADKYATEYANVCQSPCSQSSTGSPNNPCSSDQYSGGQCPGGQCPKKDCTAFDVSIGTGNLTLPLAEFGFTLYGSDISSSMLSKCHENARSKGLEVRLRQCDFRRLEAEFSNEDTHFPKQFDLVMSTGNSLAYVGNDELFDALKQMDALVSDGGYLYFDLRNWDKIVKEKTRFYLYNPVFRVHPDTKKEERINLIQVWDYLEDGSVRFNLL